MEHRVSDLKIVVLELAMSSHCFLGQETLFKIASLHSCV